MIDPFDPLNFVSAGLNLLPRDPADASVGDLQRLAAIAAGLERMTVETGADISALDYRVRHGVRRADLSQQILEADWTTHRGTLARERLAAYRRRVEAVLGADNNSPRGGDEQE